MALTLSPYAPRLTPSSLSATPSSPLRNPNMSRTVSINMDGLGDYGNDPEHVEGLDMDMVADFGDGMGVDMNFGQSSDVVKHQMVGEFIVKTLCAELLLTCLKSNNGSPASSLPPPRCKCIHSTLVTSMTCSITRLAWTEEVMMMMVSERKEDIALILSRITRADSKEAS